MTIFGIRLVGLGADTARKLLLTVVFLAALLLLRAVAGLVVRRLGRAEHTEGQVEHARFWAEQVVSLVTAAVLVVGLASIWFDDPGRLATVAGFVSAGLAVALQRVVTSFAAYLIILRGRVYTVGDRITIGGVRGDVVALGFMQTSVMEMGEAPGEQADAPATWVKARQYTGRLVRVTNDKIFDSPVYNYTREFPYVWEELHVPVKYGADAKLAESILLDVARRHTADIVRDAQPAIGTLHHHFYLPESLTLDPHVYLHLTDNWIELSVRFLARVRGVRQLKDAMSRDILAAFEAHELEIASGTYEITAVPPIRVEMARPAT
jgi:small-conductance mechanosensitive channel